ncbi:6-phosphogluconolactonase [Anabaenopsis circularis NIES-21]|uniref:6-phosphogluconolactonase n=1 Tax=Anabaenopsis circularis NIES-21 TaxID=1085406 RepID=A0A1Z4GI09_9CYAN|nr:6-phosphogluconolactonase [Anabaenopsis circularis NIES-21]
MLHKLYKFSGLLVCLLVGGLASPKTARADGAVYAMTNALGKNEIIVYHRASNGKLAFSQRIATGGGGSGIQLDPTDSLGSQGSLLLDSQSGRLFAVNTETRSNNLVDGQNVSDCQQGTISSFQVNRNGRLKLVDRIPSGGLFPNSLTVHRNLLYVLNAGGPGLNPFCGLAPNITGFKVSNSGNIHLFFNATMPINPGTSPGNFLNCDPGNVPFSTEEFRCGLNPPAFPRSPAQIGFTPDHQKLVVTVKGTNTIGVFPLSPNGRPQQPTLTQVGNPFQPTPFGFAFAKMYDSSKSYLVVTEPFGATSTIPAAPASAVSSFQIGDDDALIPITRSLPNGQGTSCWIAIDPTGQYAYIANNATSNVSSYRIGSDGSLTLLASIAAQGNRPNDLAIAYEDGKSFLYILNSGNGTVGAYQISNDGSLTSLGSVDGLPSDAGAQGIAAY